MGHPDTPPPGFESGSPELMLQNVGWVRALALRLAGHDIGADDVAQETWIRVLRNPAPAGTPFRAWVTGTMRRVVMELSRKSTNRRDREHTAARERASATSEELERQIALERDVVEHVMRLAEPARRTVMLRYFDRLPVAEIAEREGVTPSAISSRLARAYDDLRESMRDTPNSSAGVWLALALPAPAKASLLAGAAATVTALGFQAALMIKLVFAVISLGLLAVLGRFLLAPTAEPVEVARVEREGAPADESVEKLVPTSTGVNRRSAPPSVADVRSVAAPAVALAPPLEFITVRVVDAAGRDLGGLPLVAKFAHENVFSKRVWRGASGFGAAQAEIPLSRFDRPRGSEESIVDVSLVAVGLQPVSVSFDLDALPAEPLTLVASESFGSLRVRPIDMHGAPLESGVELACALEIEGLFGHGAGVKGAPGADIVLPCVALGQNLWVNGNAGPGWITELEEVQGPVVHGEEVTVELTFSTPLPTFTGRIVDGDGIPQGAGRRCTVTLECGDSGAAPLDGLIDVAVDGSFLAGFYGVAAPAGSPCSLVFARPQSTGILEVRHVTLKARARSVIPGARESVDLGDVVLSDDSPRLTGIVLDASGDPVARARVLLMTVEDSAMSRQSRSFADSKWKPGTRQFAISGEDGRFSIAIEWNSLQRGLKAVRRGLFISDVIPVTKETESVELIVRAAHTVKGTVLLPRGLGQERFSVAIVNTDEANPAYRSARIDEDGEFTFWTVGEEVIDLALVRRGGRSALARLDGVLVGAPDGRGDPRIQPWDLTGELRTVAFEVQSSLGATVTSLAMRVSGHAYYVPDGHANLSFSNEDDTILILAEGYREKRIRVGDVESIVTLESEFDVELMLKVGEVLGAQVEGWRVTLAVEGALPLDRLKAVPLESWLEETSRAHRGAHVPLAVNGTTELRVHRAGTYEALFFRPSGAKGIEPVPANEVPQALREFRLTVREAMGHQAFIVDLR